MRASACEHAPPACFLTFICSVTLLEYNGIQGMILLSELSRRRIRSIHKLLRVGRNEIVMVIRGDKDQRMSWSLLGWGIV